jgi:glycosyltransferase involved in cell wall biosynthesis
LVAAGPIEPAQFSLADAARSVPGIHAVGPVSPPELEWLYAHSTLVLVPSRYEGFGLPLLEAMACGTPVVTSRLSSLPEVVGDAALLVDPYSVDEIADGLERVLGDAKLAEELRRKGKLRAASFSWERSVKALHEGYMQVLGVPVPARPAEELR